MEKNPQTTKRIRPFGLLVMLLFCIYFSGAVFVERQLYTKKAINTIKL